MKRILSVLLSFVIIITSTASLNVSALAATKPKATSISSIEAKPAAIKVSWKKVSGVTGYQIRYSTSSKFSSSKAVKVKGAATLSKTISSLSSKKKYYVKIRTYKTANKKTTYSSYSKVKSVTTRHKNEAEATSVSKLTSNIQGFKATWSKVSKATGYQLQYSTNSSMSSAKSLTLKGAGTTSTTVKELAEKKVYYVRVRTYRTVSGTNYYSAWSSVKSVTTKADNFDDGGAYLFTYFTGNAVEEQTIHFAVSKDGYNFTPLNDNKPVITQTLGTGCCRDPYIFKGQDGYYYIIATDMDCNSQGWWGNEQNSMIFWRSKDLVNWSNETKININELIPEDTVFRCWAPQVIWDKAKKQYMVYFGLAATCTEGTHLYYCHTSNLLDINSYSEPKLLYKPADGKDAIDGDIIYDGDYGLYYLYYKDETNATICYVTSNSLTGPYTANPIKAVKTNVGLEGCNSYFITNTNTMIMLADAYSDGHFKMYKSTSFKYFSEVAQGTYEINNCSPRHGSVIAITTTQYNKLVSSVGYKILI